MKSIDEPQNPDDYIDATGHRVYRGSRWHTPKVGEPNKCAVEGCPRDLSEPGFGGAPAGSMPPCP